MGWDQYVGTRAECAEIIAAEDLHSGFPSRGSSSPGQGPRIPIQARWDGNGATPTGWTSSYGGLGKHPSSDRYSVPVPADMRGRVIGRSFAGRVALEEDIAPRGEDWSERP
jgi:hypothetical protein